MLWITEENENDTAAKATLQQTTNKGSAALPSPAAPFAKLNTWNFIICGLLFIT